MSADSLLADLVSGRAVWMPVEGGSMYPTILATDRIRVEPIRPNLIRPGDIVFVVMGDHFVLHRFVRWTKDGFAILRGDAMAREDAPLPAGRVLGRATHVRRRGGFHAPLLRRIPTRLVAPLSLWRGRFRRLVTKLRR